MYLMYLAVFSYTLHRKFQKERTLFLIACINLHSDICAWKGEIQTNLYTAHCFTICGIHYMFSGYVIYWFVDIINISDPRMKDGSLPHPRLAINVYHFHCVFFKDASLNKGELWIYTLLLYFLKRIIDQCDDNLKELVAVTPLAIKLLLNPTTVSLLMAGHGS